MNYNYIWSIQLLLLVLMHGCYKCAKSSELMRCINALPLLTFNFKQSSMGRISFENDILAVLLALELIWNDLLDVRCYMMSCMWSTINFIQPCGFNSRFRYVQRCWCKYFLILQYCGVCCDICRIETITSQNMKTGWWFHASHRMHCDPCWTLQYADRIWLIGANANDFRYFTTLKANMGMQEKKLWCSQWCCANGLTLSVSHAIMALVWKYTEGHWEFSHYFAESPVTKLLSDFSMCVEKWTI